MVSPLWQFVASSQFSELSNKSQKNSDYNGKADRHLTLMVQTEGTQENTLVRFPALNVHRLFANVLFFSGQFASSLTAKNFQNPCKPQKEDISLIFLLPTGLVRH